MTAPVSRGGVFMGSMVSAVQEGDDLSAVADGVGAEGGGVEAVGDAVPDRPGDGGLIPASVGNVGKGQPLHAHIGTCEDEEEAEYVEEVLRGSIGAKRRAIPVKRSLQLALQG